MDPVLVWFLQFAMAAMIGWLDSDVPRGLSVGLVWFGTLCWLLWGFRRDRGWLRRFYLSSMNLAFIVFLIAPCAVGAVWDRVLWVVRRPDIHFREVIPVLIEWSPGTYRIAAAITVLNLSADRVVIVDSVSYRGGVSTGEGVVNSIYWESSRLTRLVPTEAYFLPPATPQEIRVMTDQLVKVSHGTQITLDGSWILQASDYEYEFEPFEKKPMRYITMDDWFRSEKPAGPG